MAKAKIETVLFNPIFAELTAIALPERDFNKLRVTKALYPTGLAVMKALQLPHRNKNNYQRGDVLSNPKNKNRPGVLLLSRKEDGIMPGVLGVVINQGFYQVVAEIIHKQLTAKQETLAARLHDAIDLRIDSTGQTTWDNWKNIVASEFNNDAANEIFVRHLLANKACKELLLPEIEQAIKQNDPRLVKRRRHPGVHPARHARERHRAGDARLAALRASGQCPVSDAGAGARPLPWRRTRTGIGLSLPAGGR